MQSLRVLCSLGVLMGTVLLQSVHANPGEDGAQTFASANTVINSYTTLTAQSGSTFTVADAAALILPTAACPTTGCSRPLAAGDLLLIYQPQGATISVADSVSYGSISNYNNAGRYEFVYVASLAGNVITIADSDAAASTCVGGLRFTYAAGAMVVRVPQYRNVTVNTGASIVPAAWNGTTGGVVALHSAVTSDSTGTVTLNGTASINANGLGFRGGVRLDRTVVFGINNFVCATPNGAQKGEGIASGIYSSTNNLCRGAPANGGGGGNNHNAGGGGGANGGFNVSDPTAGGWTRGIGVFSATGGSGTGSPFNFLPAWAMDVEIDPDLSGANPPQTNTGGGRGGYTYAAATFDPLITGPGNASWSGDVRRVVGGLGGRPLNGTPLITDPYRRLYFGGGGGAGEMNNTQGGNGGAGGGLVFVIAQNVTGSGTLSANGAVGQDTCCSGNNDAPGGGGGGGTVVLQLRNGATVPGTMSIQANGGAGGNQGTIGPESEGPGGGGGGGVVLYPGGGTLSINGALHGNSVSSGLRDAADATTVRRFPANGATSGAPGSSALPPPRHGPSSPFSCLEGPGFSTPVSTAWFRSQLSGAQLLRIEFAAAAEIAHAGYRLEAQLAGGTRVQLGPLIGADTAAADTPRSYAVQVTLPADTEQLYLSDIDLLGKSLTRGPFLIGETYGTPPTDATYDFSQSRAQLAQSQQQLRARSSSVARLGVSERGMQRITHEQLVAAGFDLSGVAARDLAVLADFGPVPRRIRGGEVFGSGSSIEFFGDAKASLWSRERYYLLKADPSSAVQMQLTDRPVQPAAISSYTAELRSAPNLAYNHASPSGDPWYADRLLANGSAVSKLINLIGPTPVQSSGELELLLWGGIDWPNAAPDHSVEILFNGQLVASRRFDGLALERISVPVVLSGGSAQVELRLPFDTGYALDIVHLESATLRYSAAAQPQGARFFGADPQGTAWDTIFAEGGGDPPAEPIAGVITLGNIAEGERRAYRISGGVAAEFAVADTGPVAVYSRDFSDPGELWVSTASALPTPAVSAIASPDGLFGAPSDWLAISHGAFTPALDGLLALRQQQGLSTRVVDVSAIYAQYSAGNPDPQAIRQYIAAARAQLGVRYVLLVGADTLDAPGYLNSGSVSFIPTPYVTTSALVRYAPGDPLLADTDFDGVPDVSLGRLPVRTLAEAQEAVRKILAYETQPVSARAMLSAGPQDPQQTQGSFTAASSVFGGLLPSSWLIDQVHQDDLGLASARLAMVDAFNSGRSLISYMGHSGPTRWTFDPLFDISQVLGTSTDPNRPNLLASSNQPIVLQFACWTTYFVSASQNSMAQALLLSPGRGASAVVGATVLLDQTSHERMSQALAARLVVGTRIGDALLQAKRALAADEENPAGPELLLGQILLGDPAQPIR